MKAIHARYPFLEDARDAVEQAGVDLTAVVDDPDSLAVERGFERVQRAITDVDTGDPHRSTRVELLSYPVARVFVSLVDEPVLTRRYVRAEASTAHERFESEFTETAEFQSMETDTVDLERMLAEFDLDDAVSRDADEYWVEVGRYLELAAGVRGEEWRLVNRALTDGFVPLDESELHVLLREAVRERVAADLPFAVPDEIAAPIEERAEELRTLLAELDLTRDIDTVVPDLFPPCMKHLLDQIRKGAHLQHHSRFAITAFLATIGMDTDEIVELYRVNSSFGEEMTRYQTDHIRGETSPTEYTPPSCATMQSYGDCVNMDDRCERISHPLAYYEAALDDADDDVEDWRDAEADGEEEEAA